MNHTRIYIPSRGRAGWLATLAAIPPQHIENTFVVCTPGESKQYKAALQESWYPSHVIEAAKSVDCIGKKRQWIMEHARKDGVKFVIMLDDDMTFAKRRKDDPTKFAAMEDSDYSDMFSALEDLHFIQGFSHIGMLAREGGNRVTADVVFSTRMTRVLCYDVDAFFRHKVKFTRLRLMEDFDVTLQLLRSGSPNAVLCSYVHNQAGSNTAGGCSLYRTMEAQEAAAMALHALHPDFVKVVRKQTKSAWGGQERTDVIVSWKKAYESSKL